MRTRKNFVIYNGKKIPVAKELATAIASGAVAYKFSSENKNKKEDKTPKK